MEIIKIKHVIYLIPLFILLSCDNTVTLEPDYNNFSGSWAHTFIWRNGTTMTGTYTLKNDGNVNCSGETCTENNANYSLISRTWTSIGDKITVTLKYTELNNNNRLVTGDILGTQFSKDRISGTLSYSNGASGTWTANKDSSSIDEVKKIKSQQNYQLPL